MLRTVVAIFIILGSFGVLADDTELKFYRPFVNSMQFMIKEKKAGECWQQSQRIQREDAWRCVAEGKTYDPCFINPHGSRKEAICPDSPWVNNALMLNLTTPVDNSQHLPLDMSKAYPWALELSTGEKCLAIDEGQIYDGLQIYYQCERSSVLFGRLQRCEARWSMLQRKVEGVSTASVIMAWF